MLNLKIILTALFTMLCLFLQACGSEDTPQLANKVSHDNNSLSQLVDQDLSPNQVNDSILVNKVNVGITVYAEGTGTVTYQMLDSAEGRFSIDENSGVVYVSDYLLFNGSLLSNHTINVQATDQDGQKNTQEFTIDVSTEKLPISGIIDINLLPNEISERVENGVEVGITANAIDVKDSVAYKLLEDGAGRFKVDNGSGVVTVANGSILNAQQALAHEIEIEANSTDGTASSKKFVVDVLPNYENDIPIVSQYNTLLNWNEGSQKFFDGWTWHNDIAYGNPGWLLNDDGPIGGGEQYQWGWGARSFNKGDYGKDNTALIDTVDISPSTSIGGSLQVTETANSTDHRSTWWVWYDGKPLSDRGITNAKTDRMSFYLKTEGMKELNDDGGKESIGNNFHIGTYLCWEANEPAYGTGDGCPYEGKGNQHYYHYLAINPGAWIHVLLDQHPQHIRGGKGTLQNNPPQESYQKNYFEQISRFYFEIREQQSVKTSFNIDELNYFSSNDMVETEQNDESITSLWIGYWKSKDVWEIGFHDESYQQYNDDMNSTFEVRWSTAPITNDNFYAATLIKPMFYSGIEVAGVNSEYLLRRSNGWTSNVWTRFELPDEVENNYKKVFFAVKDVSKLGKHIGTRWPYNKGDGHDAPTDNIKIIDYYLR
ncbi:cadherin repeat domain-containing protein [Colwellia sp. 1_MG-2023]|jgi:hypothetical protein|uniref:cadherin repeat domain-containing protein n=1 Tax=unclassified Colwellia TaxID=196834 RepID=UPI001C09C96D|nr:MULTISPECIES: cadherin repeat domain-containing protein [unclassified Colwellia]MBU2924934.1 cadherin repeat domain-containing protein [Colwellia sp. C2M11]MDO6652834.1 cadherin repeat domain-containing protein [Colwellia sp. 3_MG-2023]MDO6665836.1 cadherin repeat domain-containing protein [Colwellia sp. 2_MG-2023]MDO6690209.1 cadherin repeat domain-containing protein [Colwellia sp. 1_MG-2023]